MILTNVENTLIQLNEQFSQVQQKQEAMFLVNWWYCLAFTN